MKKKKKKKKKKFISFINITFLLKKYKIEKNDL